MTIKYSDHIDTNPWSEQYERCVKCGTTEVSHLSRGYCRTCYHKLIEKRHKDLNRIRKYGYSSAKLTKQYLINEYVKKKKSLGDIALECNCSRQYVYKRLKHHEISPREKSEARSIALKNKKVTRIKSDENGETLITLRKVNINKKFFSSWSEMMAYVLGVIYTDGNLQRSKLHRPGGKLTDTSYKFTITQKEPELLIKVLSLMKCDAKIYCIKNNNIERSAYTFQVGSKKIYKDLMSLGLHSKKSLTIDFPDIPKRYVRHFIRGCWDGDGTVYIDKRSRRIRSSFVSGSQKFIEGFAKALADAGLPKRRIYVLNRGRNPSYTIRFSERDCAKLYHYLYDRVPESQYLSRKHKIFYENIDHSIQFKPKLQNNTCQDQEVLSKEALNLLSYLKYCLENELRPHEYVMNLDKKNRDH